MSHLLHSHNITEPQRIMTCTTFLLTPALNNLPLCAMADAMADGPPIQCWTCRRKRLVCDSTRPACKKCFKRGTVCLGYGAKPLTWVEPVQKKSFKCKDRRHNSESVVEVPDMAIIVPRKPRFKGVDASLSRSFDSQAVLHAIDYCEYFNANHVTTMSCDLILSSPWRQRHGLSRPSPSRKSRKSVSLQHVRCAPSSTYSCA